MQLIFEKSRPGRRSVQLDPLDVPEASLPEALCRQTPAALPEVSELDVVRHFTRLSQRNFGIDTHFYPLGSCTMKYNPKFAECVAALPGFRDLHPHLARVEAYQDQCQGALELVYRLERLLAQIGGMEATSLQPLAGAHGELAGALLIAAYHRDKGRQRQVVLVPDSAHGTNPASAAIAGFEVVQVPSDKRGVLDFDAFHAAMDDTVAAVMLTCPNTHGLFEPDVRRIAEYAHKHDALLYYDGANLNAILGRCRPGDMGFDVMHFNLHKTFATPHGMGGPGAGPIGVSAKLAPFLPGPRVAEQNGCFSLTMPDKSIGAMSLFLGNFLVAVRAYAYILRHGGPGLRSVADHAVLHANYVYARLKEAYAPAFEGRCMHECVLSAQWQADSNVHALDIAKALLDRGIHAPTVYFPLTVKESLMIEPTETEAMETLDTFCDAMLDIARLVVEAPEQLTSAPVTTPVGRLDEVRAARELNCAF
jgi:glycine dehydrogenase subunit 2